MSFTAGLMSFKRFFVEQGRAVRSMDSLIEALRAHTVDADALRMQDGSVWGWVTGDHLLDTRFSPTKNQVGNGLYFALRTDVNKPPANLVHSYQRQAEEAMLEASGREFLSRIERREAREQARARAEEEAKAGAFRRSRQIPVYWDIPGTQVFVGTTSLSALDQFTQLFHRTFGQAVTAATAGEMALRWASSVGEVTAFDQCQPSHFIEPPASAEMPAEMIRTAGAPSRDFLGTEWLLWLWHATHVESPEVRMATGQTVTVLFDRSLQMECAFGLTGKLALATEGPTRAPEAAVALSTGKRPIRVGLHIAVRGEIFELNIRGDLMNVSGVKLPPPSEEARHPKLILEERMEAARRLVEALEGVYAAFLKKRFSSRWPQTLNAIRNWVAGGQAKPHAPAEMTA